MSVTLLLRCRWRRRGGAPELVKLVAVGVFLCQVPVGPVLSRPGAAARGHGSECGSLAEREDFCAVCHCVLLLHFDGAFVSACKYVFLEDYVKEFEDHRWQERQEQVLHL